MFCEKCGSNLLEGAKFCSKCGWSVPAAVVSGGQQAGPVQPKQSQAAQQPNPNSVQFSQTVGQMSQTTQQMSLAANQSGSMQSQSAEPKKNNKKLAVILSIVAAAVVVLGVAAFFLFSGKGSNEAPNEFDGYLKQAEIFAEKGFYEDAVEYYKKALEIDPNADSIYDILSELYRTIDANKGSSDIGGAAPRPDVYDDLFEVEPPEEMVGDAGIDVIEEPIDVQIEIRQVDSSDFPNMTLYANITDFFGNSVTDLGPNDFLIREITAKGKEIEIPISEMYQMLNQDSMSIGLVMDVSYSMIYDDKINHAKDAAIRLVQQMNLEGGDEIEIIAFDTFVSIVQGFTQDRNSLITSISDMYVGEDTALYDGIYSGIYQTNSRRGAKCVIAFTDGQENASSYTYDDVVELARATGIPVFIIGIGSEYDVDASSLGALANACSGKYYSAATDNLASILEDIYVSIYQAQKDSYVIEYTATNTKNKDKYRDVVLESKPGSFVIGSCTREYIPEPDLSGAFSSAYSNKDFMIPDSSDRSLSYSDLSGLTLAQLRIARNEIFARHGRQFNDPLLNQWFYSKKWYLDIRKKYSPKQFENLSPYPITKLETENINFIKEYENMMMSTQDIFPNASYELLSEYDMALSKEVLRTALGQMEYYPQTDTLKENIANVTDTLNKSDIKY